MSFGGKLHPFFASPLEGEAGSDRLGDASREGGEPNRYLCYRPPSLTLPLKGGGDVHFQLIQKHRRQ
jgi:hypothetical protein